METERITEGISYKLRRNRGQRNLRLRIDPSGGVVVSAPYHAPNKEIDDFVSRSRSWIEKQVGKVAVHTYQTGDFVPYLGERKALVVIEGKKASYDIVDDKIIITARKCAIESVKKTIKRADHIAAWFEATQLAGFSQTDAAKIFGRPNSLNVLISSGMIRSAKATQPRCK